MANALAETWLKKRFALDMPRTCEKWVFEKE